LRITRQAAQTRVAMAAALRSRMPCLLAAMDAGELDEHKARQTVDATAPLPDDLARRVDAIIATRIGTKHPSAWRTCLTRVVPAVDPAGVHDRVTARRKDRHIALVHEPDAMTSPWAYLPAEVASVVYARVDAMARKLKTRGEERTVDQLRADVLADICLPVSVSP
jgi:hypothetical protein